MAQKGIGIVRTDNKVRFDVYRPLIGNANIVIIDILENSVYGKTVSSSELMNLVIPINGFVSGVYFIELKSGQFVESKKILIVF